MSKASTFIEMAVPLQQHKERDYYHGTPSSDKARRIQLHGLMSGIKGHYKGSEKPVGGQVYLASNIKDAFLYSLGYPGPGWWEKKLPTIDKDLIEDSIKEYGRYSYVFVIKGSQLKNVQPDEDDIVNLLAKDTFPWLTKMAFDTLSGKDQEYMKEHDMQIKDLTKALWTVAKRLYKKLSNEQKLAIIDAGDTLAHKGDLKVSPEIWQVDRTKLNDFKSDGSNFFQVAKKVKEIGDKEES